jgi:CRP-like cAMP-binding protein
MNALRDAVLARGQQTESVHFLNSLSPFSRFSHHNQLLATLGADGEQVRRSLRLVDLPMGHVLCEEGRAPKTLIFPTTAIVSILCLTVDGSSSEVGVVGNDGVIGFGFPVDSDPNPFRVVVQSAGAGYVMDAPTQLSQLPCGDRLSEQMTRFSRSLVAQIAQSAVCNRFHSLEQQLCRRLLMGLDRSPHAELLMTQESIALLMGVRREGVTAAALSLRQAGLIQYRRGHIDVIDRAGLEARACECYALAKRAYERHRPHLMPQALQQLVIPITVGRPMDETGRADGRALQLDRRSLAQLSGCSANPDGVAPAGVGVS